MIKINNITKIYKKKDEEFRANNNINLHIEKGTIVGFLGGNGAGKTTLIKTICNLIIPTEGNVEIGGKDVNKNPEVVHEKVGVLLEGARNLYNFLTVEENANYFSYLNEIPKEKFEENKEYFLKLFDLYEKKNEPVNNLSRGMQQKVAIMVAILKDPDVLILDEPTLGLDIVSKLKMQEVLKKLAKELDKTLIISSHDMSVIEDICDKVAIINKGELLKYDSIHSIIMEGAIEKYQCIVGKEEYIEKLLLEKKIEFESLEGDLIQFQSDNIDEIMEHIKGSHIIKIEKISNNIENVLRKLGE